VAGQYDGLGTTLWGLARAKLGRPAPLTVAGQVVRDHQPLPVATPPILPLLPSGVPMAHKVVNRLERRRYRMSRPSAYADVSTLRRLDGALREVVHQPKITRLEAIRTNQALVVSVCEKYDLDYFVIPEPNELRRRIGIASPDWDAFIAALAEQAQLSPVSVRLKAQTPSGRLVRSNLSMADPKVAESARTQDRLRIFTYLSPKATRGPVYAEVQSCLVERWTQNESTGALSAPAPNRRTSYISGAYREPIRQQRDGIEVRTLQAFELPDVFEITFPIDLVYTWVNGNDPEWRERKQAALTAAGLSDHPGALDTRFNDNGELRYSLRSVEQFAPWVRNIYLVTDQQVPDWLDPEQTRITIVDHRDIFPADALPTFNSHSIEARLHTIPNLSEHFLYLNDDFFLGQPVSPYTFFDSNGTSKFFLSRRLTLDFHTMVADRPHDEARRNAISLIKRDFGVTAGRAFRHAPMALRRSLLTELEQRYPEEFESTWRSQFRHRTDYQITSWLHNYYGYLTGKARPANIRYAYLDPGIPRYREPMKRLLKARDVSMFCINETVFERTEAEHAQTRKWLATYFPTPSSFERPPTTVADSRGGADADRS